MKYYKENLLSMISNKQLELLDFKDWVLRTDEGTDDLKKWIKYTAGDYPDADEVLKINDDKGCVLIKLGWFQPDVRKKEQYIDCIFSMKTFFMAFLRLYLADLDLFKDGKSFYFSRILDHYDCIVGDKHKENFCSNHGIERDDINKLFREINRFARNTHTIGNYMPCPDNEYNRLKGGAIGKYKGYQYFKDRLELLYLELYEPKHEGYLSDKKNDWRKWFTDSEQKLLLKEILKSKYGELLKFRFDGRVMEPDDIIQYIKYLDCINGIIERRGVELKKGLQNRLQA